MAEEIWHHGIKGQKWGVIRTPAQPGHELSEKVKSQYSDDYNKAHDNKPAYKMSDAELRARLNRLNMEEQYSRLHPSAVERGKRLLNSTIKVAGTVAAVSTTAITLKNNWKTISGWFED